MVSTPTIQTDELREILLTEGLALEDSVQSYANWIESYAKCQYSWYKRALRPFYDERVPVSSRRDRYASIKLSDYPGVNVFRALCDIGCIDHDPVFAELITDELRARGWRCHIVMGEVLIRPISEDFS